MSDSTLREAVCVADVAFSMFFNDIKAMVKAGVEADINKSQSNNGSPGLELRVSERRKRLKQWLAMPSSGLLDFAGDNYANLLRILVTDPQAIVHGLPDASINEISTLVFAKSLYDMVEYPTRNPLGAPILPKGAFWPAIQVAIAHIKAMAPVDPPNFVVNVLRLTTEIIKIHFIPWSKMHDGPGRPSRIPVWNSWASLGASDPNRGINTLTLRPEEAIHRAALKAQQIAMDRDVNASWTLNDIKLRNLANDLNHDSLPSDWTIPSQSSLYVLETYNYVRDIYNNKNEIHRLALLVAIVLGRCLPEIHAPPDTHKLLLNLSTRSETRRVVRDLPWVSKTKTKGSKESHIHVTMFATFIIALYDSESPLRKYMANHDDSLGSLWTDKHSSSFILYLSPLFIYLLLSGPKGVVSFNLFRVGLTWGIGSKAHSSGRFNRNWGLLPVKDLSALLHDLETKLKSPAYGVGDVLVILLGRVKAEEVALKENVVLRVPMVSTASKRPLELDGISDIHGSCSKRSHLSDSDSAY